MNKGEERIGDNIGAAGLLIVVGLVLLLCQLIALHLPGYPPPPEINSREDFYRQYPGIETGPYQYQL